MPSSDFSSFTLFAFMGGLHCVRVYSYLKVIFYFPAYLYEGLKCAVLAVSKLLSPE